MKTIELKKVTVLKQTAPTEVNYSEWIKTAINVPPQHGFTVDDIRWRIKVVELIEKAHDDVSIEDAEFDKVKKCINDMKWNIVDEEIVIFIDYINSL